MQNIKYLDEQGVSEIRSQVGGKCTYGKRP